MSIDQVHKGPKLPESLRDQLLDFRRRVWSAKATEALAIAAFGLLAAYLAVFALDRALDTPGWLRWSFLAAAFAVGMVLPIFAYRWIWRRRQLPQLARLLTKKHPLVGDQLLGVIELAESESEQSRSRALCEAAIAQVAADAARRDFSDAVPAPQRRRWLAAAAAPSFVALLLAALAPAAAGNAWLRFLAPWKNTPRYTFAALAELPERLVVPHGEPFSLFVQLHPRSRWRPTAGTARYGGQLPIAARLSKGEYLFEMPPQLEADWLSVRVGDAVKRIRVEPTLRPELVSAQATITLPDYLGRAEKIAKDVRGGSLSVVKASRVALSAEANRALASAKLDGQSLEPKGAKVAAPASLVEDSRKLELTWQDQDGLSALAPFTLALQSREDEAPVVACENLPRQKVVLDTEQLNFTVKAFDDFGVKRVGIEWHGIEEEGSPVTPAEGERLLAAGGCDQEQLEAVGAFCAKTLGIAPQPVNVRIYVEDYLPGRKRVYSPNFTFYILTAEEHAVWLTEQLNKWQRQSLEVRDRELQLYETNKELRELPPEELDEPESRKQIERQAAAERANGQRLAGLVASGEQLVAEAARNPQFGVGHLEKWAEMLQVLKDISGNRMPSVADLLKQAAQAPAVAAKPPQPAGPKVGEVRAAAPPGSEKPSDDKQAAAKPPVPAVVDVESTQMKEKPQAGGEAPPSKPSSPRLGLPTTTVLGGVKKSNESCPANEQVEEAVRQQEDLLAEFEKVADELNRILANLEGSTFLKRLKAAARKETQVAGELSDRVSGEFGVADAVLSAGSQAIVSKLADRQKGVSENVGVILEDMLAYYERRRQTKFKLVSDEMKQLDVVSKLARVGEEMPKETGLSIAQCEYWSDTLDRWAEDLLDPRNDGH